MVWWLFEKKDNETTEKKKDLKIKNFNVLVVDGENIAGQIPEFSQRVIKLSEEVEAITKELQRNNLGEKTKRVLEQSKREKENELRKLAKLFAYAVLGWVIAVKKVGKTEEVNPRVDLLFIVGGRVVYSLYRYGLYDAIKEKIQHNRWNLVVPNTQFLCKGIFLSHVSEMDDYLATGIIYALQKRETETFGKFLTDLGISVGNKLLTEMLTRIREGEEGLIFVSNDNIVWSVFKGDPIMIFNKFQYKITHEGLMLTIYLAEKKTEVIFK